MKERGFTLLEVLVVSSITVLLAGLLVQNFSRSRTDLNQTVLTVADAIRQAQAQALAGSLFAGKYRCGYGIHFSLDSYIIYAGPDSEVVDCSAQDRNYNAGTDATVTSYFISNASLEVVGADDIFFEPPDPKTYINGQDTPGMTTSVYVRRKGAACPSTDCRTISVSTAGRIQTQ